MRRYGRLSRKEIPTQLSAASTPSYIRANTLTGHQMCKHMVLFVSVVSKQRQTVNAAKNRHTDKQAAG